MKSKWIIASLLMVALLAICGASVYAVWVGAQMVQESGVHLRLGAQNTSATATEEKTVTVSGPAELSVVNDFGDVSVVNGPDGKISVTVEKTAWGANEAQAQAALKDLKVNYDQSGNKLKITVQQPMEVNTLQIGSGGGSFQFTIQVPADTAVTVNSSNGNLTLKGTSGQADLQSEFGNLELSDLTGEVFGQTSNGSVTAKNLNTDQKVTLSSEFGEITAEKVRGSELTLASTNGQLDLTGLQASGQLKATSEYGPINLRDSQAATVVVGSDNGDVTLTKLTLTGKLSAKSEFGGLLLTGVKASAYELTTQNGKIKADWAQGPITAHSEFGEVEILNAENATLNLSSNNGGVTFSGSLGAGPHQVTSEFGELKLSLPAETALQADLQTEFGEISSDFDLTLTVKGEVDQKHLQGKINGGGPLLTVKTNNGNILLKTLK